MKRLILLAVAGLTAVVSIAPNAMAYYWDAKGNVYSDVSQFPNMPMTGYVDGIPKAFNIKTDACGMAEIKMLTPAPSYPEFRVGDTGGYYSRLDLPVAAAVTCDKTTGQLSAPRTTSFRLSPAVPGTDFIYIGTPNTTVKMWRTAKVTLKSTKNACGIAKTRLKLDPVGMIGRDDSPIYYDLPGESGDELNRTIEPNPPVCRKNATGGGSLYVKSPG